MSTIPVPVAEQRDMVARCIAQAETSAVDATARLWAAIRRPKPPTQ